MMKCLKDADEAKQVFIFCVELHGMPRWASVRCESLRKDAYVSVKCLLPT